MAWLGAEYVDPDAPRMSEVIQLRVYPRVIPKDNALLVAAISAAIHSRPRSVVPGCQQPMGPLSRRAPPMHKERGLYLSDFEFEAKNVASWC